MITHREAVMKGKIAAVALLTVFASDLACASDNDGNSMLMACKSLITQADTGASRDDGYEKGQCAGIVNATMKVMSIYSVAEALPTNAKTCFPANITLGQAIRIVIKSLENDPASLNQDRTYLTMLALHKAYQCK